MTRHNGITDTWTTHTGTYTPRNAADIALRRAVSVSNAPAIVEQPAEPISSTSEPGYGSDDASPVPEPELFRSGPNGYWYAMNDPQRVGFVQRQQAEDRWHMFNGTHDDDDDTCDQCGATLDDGEGYDGLCGNCADAAEHAATHYHVVAFQPGCLNDYDSGPIETRADAIDAMHDYIGNGGMQPDRHCLWINDDTVRNGLYTITIETCTERDCWADAEGVY